MLKLTNIFYHLFMLIAIFVPNTLFCAEQEYTFGVISQRSAVQTAQIWNPIFAYVEKKSGIKLVLKTTRTGEESKKATDAGEYDFTYSNVIFDAKHIIYTPILQPNTDGISGQIVVLEDSQTASIKDLDSKTIGFPSKIAFVGYAVPTDYLKKQHISFLESFGGNQEGIMGQLKSGAVSAASVNNIIMKAYAKKENLKYRVLWDSQKFPDIPIAVHERVPSAVSKKVQESIANMSSDPEGKQILDKIQETTKQPFTGFSIANMQTYKQYVDFYKNQTK